MVFVLLVVPAADVALVRFLGEQSALLAATLPGVVGSPEIATALLAFVQLALELAQNLEFAHLRLNRCETLVLFCYGLTELICVLWLLLFRLLRA